MTIKQPGVIGAIKLLSDQHMRAIVGPDGQRNQYGWSYISAALWRKVNDDVRIGVGDVVASHVRDDWIAEEFLRESPRK